MRIFQPSTLFLVFAVCASTAIAQSQNDYDASTSGDFNDQSRWGAGQGPSSWQGGTRVKGSLDFNGVAGSITVSNINSNFTWITGLSTTGGGDLRLEGTGSLSFFNGGGTIEIAPSGGLTFAVDTFFRGAVHLNMTNADASDEMTIENMMSLSGKNALLMISGLGTVHFEDSADLSMRGTIMVGSSTDQGHLQIDSSETLGDSAVSLVIGTDSTVTFGVNTTINETFSIWGLTGDGLFQTVSDDNSAHVLLQGGDLSEFNGRLVIDGDFAVSGSNTMFYYNPTSILPSIINGAIQAVDGGSFLMGSQFADAWLANVEIFINGGMFGGNGRVNLNGTNPSSALSFDFFSQGGWLVGGDPFTGEGSLELLGGNFVTNFWPGNGLWVNVNGDSVYGHGAYISFATTSVPIFYSGSTLHVNVIGDTYIATNVDIIMMQYTGGLVPPLILYVGGDAPDFSLSTNLVTRYIDYIDTFSAAGDADEIVVRLGADYETPAGDLSGIGNALNQLIAIADADPQNPNNSAAVLLGLIDSYATSFHSYQQALSWMLPTAEFVADRVAANTMFYEVQRRNIRELAIGTRAPGMLKAAEQRNAMLYASIQEEESAATVADDRTTRVVIQPGPGKKPDTDVFQALYVDGYGRWDDMDSVGFVPGYTADVVGVEAGWGIGLSHGITLGFSAGWEQVSATLDNDLGNIELNSIRGAPFVAWSGISGKTEQYVILTAGGGYNYGHGRRENVFGTNATVDLHGWEFGIEGAVGSRLPINEVLAVQPEASIRYSVVHFDGTEDNQGSQSDYSGDDFQFVNARVGAALEWLVTGSTRLTARLGYQGQYLHWGEATFALAPGLPPPLNMATESGGSGNVNQAYVGLQLEWAPSWNTAITINYDGAYGQAMQNAISGGVLLRF